MFQTRERSALEELKKAQALLYEAKQTGNNIAIGCQQNEQKLLRIHDNLKGINGTLNKAEHNAKLITSFWYRVKTKITTMFVSEDKKDIIQN